MCSGLFEQVFAHLSIVYLLVFGLLWACQVFFLYLSGYANVQQLTSLHSSL